MTAHQSRCAPAPIVEFYLAIRPLRSVPDTSKSVLATLNGRRLAALEVGVDNANLLVVAIDNGSDRAAYVGPISSFYSFTDDAGRRTTDEEWQMRLESGNPPAHPEFTAPYRATPKPRELGAIPRVDRWASDPRAKNLIEKLHTVKGDAERART